MRAAPLFRNGLYVPVAGPDRAPIAHAAENDAKPNELVRAVPNARSAPYAAPAICPANLLADAPPPGIVEASR